MLLPSVDLRAIERARLRSLVERDIETALTLHHPDFQLITPRGFVLSRAQYFDEIATGTLRYLSWQPEHIAVRQSGDAAVLRYRATIEMDSDGRRLPAFTTWHTDTYEHAGGRWMAVWSHATFANLDS